MHCAGAVVFDESTDLYICTAALFRCNFSIKLIVIIITENQYERNITRPEVTYDEMRRKVWCDGKILERNVNTAITNCWVKNVHEESDDNELMTSTQWLRRRCVTGDVTTLVARMIQRLLYTTLTMTMIAMHVNADTPSTSQRYLKRRVTTWPRNSGCRPPSADALSDVSPPDSLCSADEQRAFLPGAVTNNLTGTRSSTRICIFASRLLQLSVVWCYRQPGSTSSGCSKCCRTSCQWHSSIRKHHASIETTSLATSTATHWV